MKTINIILVTILSVILASCQTDGTHGTETFTLEDFKTVQLSDADTIKCDGMLLARPASILFHPDNFLLVADRKNVKLLHIIDLQDKSSRMVLHSGRTENELLAIWDMTLKSKDVIYHPFTKASCSNFIISRRIGNLNLRAVSGFLTSSIPRTNIIESINDVSVILVS